MQDGSHAVVVMGDMVMKGVAGVNASAVFAATADAIAIQDAQGSYLSLGYLAVGEDDQAATATLEFAYDDGIAALVAAFVGESASASAWSARSKNYRNVFNANASIPCPRTVAGTWQCPEFPAIPYPFDSGYLEGNALQYQTFAPHDQAGLMSCFSSVDAYVEALTTLQVKQQDWIFGTTLPNSYYWAGTCCSVRCNGFCVRCVRACESVRTRSASTCCGRRGCRQ
ncbi:hypothetical protein EON66_00200 [archaeon]|nr:MAG: hypothetical protein EON66_00200 [archaeon]